jgi:hypothetical protein
MMVMEQGWVFDLTPGRTWHAMSLQRGEGSRTNDGDGAGLGVRPHPRQDMAHHVPTAWRGKTRDEGIGGEMGGDDVIYRGVCVETP